MKKVILLLASLLVTSVSHAQNSVKFLLDIPPNGTHSWITSAEKDGVFKKYGFDVEFAIGNGSINTGIALSSGAAQIGYHDFSGVVIVNSKQTKPGHHAVFVADDKFQDALWSLPDSDIKTWGDIKTSTTVAGFPTGTARNVLPAIIDVMPEFVNTPFPLRAPSIVSKKTDMTEGYLTSMYFDLKKLGVTNPTVFSMGDRLPFAISKVVSVNTEWAEKNPVLVKKLVAALREAMSLHLNNPAHSILSLSGPLVATEDLKKLELERAKYAIENIVQTEFVKKNGVSNPTALNSRLDQYVTFLVNKLKLTTRHKNSDYFRLEGGN